MIVHKDSDGRAVMGAKHWTDAYIGIPFKEGGRDFPGCDCGGLVLLALRTERGVTASDFTDYETADFSRMDGYGRLGAGIEALMREWVVVEKPRPFDLLRFRYGRYPAHVGVWAGHGDYFLHVEESGLYSRLTRLNDRTWGPRFIEFRRHERLV